MSKMPKFTTFIIGLLIIVIISDIAYGIFIVKRTWNYKLGYESMVQKQIDTSLEKHIKEYHNHDNQR